MKNFKIGNINLKSPLILSPMVDVTNLPYRLICRKAGASLAYTEMINITAILHPNKKTQQMMQTSQEDHPLGIQLTSPDINYFKKLIPILNKKDYQLVDINCGCPSNRITDNKSGAFLLKSPKKIASYIKLLKDSGFIATAKIRLGFKNNNVLKIAKEIEKAGADAIAVHARLSWHSYKIPADWIWIKKVKANLGIPIIGNGDIMSGQDVKKMLEIADGAMIARGAIGDPAIFSRIQTYLKTGKEPEFSFKENLSYFKEYLKLAKANQLLDIKKSKFLGSNFIRNIPKAAELRNKFMQLKSFNEIESFIDNLDENIKA